MHGGKCYDIKMMKASKRERERERERTEKINNFFSFATAESEEGKMQFYLLCLY
jgi:hypothetical protein